MERIIDLDNDGLNIAMDEDNLFLRCKREIIKISLSTNEIINRITLFKKEGKARYITISNNYVCVLDFCDVYVLRKQDLSTVLYKRIGIDASSDLVSAKCDDENVYVSIRHGKIGVLSIVSGNYNEFDVCGDSTWEFTLYNDKLYVGTTSGTLYEIDTDKMEILKQCKLGNKNIYGIQVDGDYIYTISQDSSLKIIDKNTFEVIKTIRNAVKGMCRILGVYNEYVVIADRGISLWNKNNFSKVEKLSIPTGHFNKGACLLGNTLIGSDYQSLFIHKL